MAGFDQLYSNPMAMAGLAVLGGKNMGDALTQSAQTSAMYQRQQAYQQKAEQAQQLQARLPQILQGLDPNDPMGAYGKLVEAGLPPQYAGTIVETISKQNRFAQEQAGMDKFFGAMNGSAPSIPLTQGEPMAAPVAEATPVSQAPQALPVDPYEDQINKGRMAMQFGIEAKNPGIVQYGNSLVTQATEERRRSQDQTMKQNQRQEDIALKEKYRAEDKAAAEDKPLSSESATRLSLVKQGDRAIADIKGLIYKPDGSMDKFAIADAKLSTPLSSEGRRLKSAMHSAANAKLRLETGATAPDQEKVDAELAYLPGLLDNDKDANYKLGTMDNFFKDYQEAGGRKKDRTPMVGGGGAPTAAAGVPASAVEYLKANPGLAADFEKKYGASAKQYLGQQ